MLSCLELVSGVLFLNMDETEHCSALCRYKSKFKIGCFSLSEEIHKSILIVMNKLRNGVIM